MFMRFKKLTFLSKLEPSVMVYVISKDQIFVNKLMLDLGSNTSYDIVPHLSGEGFFKEIVYNPLPKNTIPVVILDYNLKSHDHENAKDGLLILEEIKQFRPKWDIILIAEASEKRVKNQGLKQGAAAFVFKNENILIRVRNHIYTLMNQKKMIAEKRYTSIAIIIFSLSLISFGSIMAYLYWHYTL